MKKVFSLLLVLALLLPAAAMAEVCVDGGTYTVSCGASTAEGLEALLAYVDAMTPRAMTNLSIKEQPSRAGRPFCGASDD